MIVSVQTNKNPDQLNDAIVNAMAKMGLHYSSDHSSEKIWAFEPTFGMMSFLFSSAKGTNWSPYHYVRSCSVEFGQAEVRFAFRKTLLVLIPMLMIAFFAVSSFQFGAPVLGLSWSAIMATALALHYFWAIGRIESEVASAVEGA